MNNIYNTIYKYLVNLLFAHMGDVVVKVYKKYNLIVFTEMDKH